MAKGRPEPQMKCGGVLDGGNIPALNTKLLAMGVTGNDRHELLKFASLLGLPEEQRLATCLANDDGETENVDLRPKGGDHGE